MRVGIPYKVIGGTRFYDRREIKDALAYLRAVVNPIDEVCVKRVLNVPKRGHRRRHRRPSSTPGPTAHGVRVHRRAAAGRRRRRHRQGGQGHRQLPRAARRAERPGRGRPRPAARGDPRPHRLPRRAGGRAHHRGRGAAREPGRAGRLGRGVRRRRRVPRAGEPRGRHRRDRRPSDDSRRAHDAPRGQGPRVPGGVHHRHGGRRVPAPALDRRARRAGGGAPPRLRRHHPGPGAPLPDPRVEPHALRRHAVQPAEPVPRRDPRAPGRGGEGQPRHAPPGQRLGWRGRHATASAATATRSSSGRSRPPRPEPSGAEALGLRIGDDVRHASLRRGRDPPHQGEGDKAEAVVNFPASARSGCCSAGRRSKRLTAPGSRTATACRRSRQLIRRGFASGRADRGIDAADMKTLERAGLLLRRDHTLGTIMDRLERVHGDRRLVAEADGGLRSPTTRRPSG